MAQFSGVNSVVDRMTSQCRKVGHTYEKTLLPKGVYKGVHEDSSSHPVCCESLCLAIASALNLTVIYICHALVDIFNFLLCTPLSKRSSWLICN